jgi:hypothetical protein
MSTDTWYIEKKPDYPLNYCFIVNESGQTVAMTMAQSIAKEIVTNRALVATLSQALEAGGQIVAGQNDLLEEVTKALRSVTQTIENLVELGILPPQYRDEASRIVGEAYLVIDAVNGVGPPREGEQTHQ